MNNKVNFLRGTSAEYESSTKDNDTFYYTTDDEKLYLGNKEITGGGVTIDDSLSDTSKNPVQNKVINAALNSKANLSDIPTTLPANGGNSDTLDGKHANDFVENILNQNHHFSMVYGDHAYITNAMDSNVPNLPISNYIHIVSRRDNGEVETVLSIGVDYTKNVYVYRKNDGIWKNLSDGGNAATLETHPASDFALKTDIPTTLPANGGNADTLDGKHAESFMQWLGTPDDIGFMNDANYQVDYHCTMGDGTKIGLPIAGWYHIVYYHQVNPPGYSGYGMQIAYPLNFDGATFIRRSDGTTWKDWKNIADGGTAVIANYAGNVSATLSNNCLRNISAGTADLSAGVSELATGAIYLVYE